MFTAFLFGSLQTVYLSGRLQVGLCHPPGVWFRKKPETSQLPLEPLPFRPDPPGCRGLRRRRHRCGRRGRGEAVERHERRPMDARSETESPADDGESAWGESRPCFESKAGHVKTR